MGKNSCGSAFFHQKLFRPINSYECKSNCDQTENAYSHLGTKSKTIQTQTHDQRFYAIHVATIFAQFRFFPVSAVIFCFFSSSLATKISYLWVKVPPRSGFKSQPRGAMRLIIWIVLAGLILCHGRKRPSGRGQLPVFSSDFSEFFIAAVIERSFDTDNLYLTTFLMGHKSLFHMPQMPFLLINNSVSTTHKWREAGRQWKERSNRNDTFTCRMKNSLAVVKESVQETPALWGPSSTTNDGGFNRNFEVLRCMIPRDINIVATLADQKQKLSKAIKNARLSVEIIRTRNHGHIHGTDSQTPTRANLIAFEVPWKDRRTGYGFDLSRRNSRWEPWQGVLSPPRSRQQFSFNGVKEGDVPLNASSSTRGQTSSFRMSPISVVCMSIVRPLEPFRMDTGMTMLVENIEHNILIGFDHIFVGLHLDPLSVHMQRYRLALDPFIRAGRVSLSSMALSGFDDVAGYHGVS